MTRRETVRRLKRAHWRGLDRLVRRAYQEGWEAGLTRARGQGRRGRAIRGGATVQGRSWSFPAQEPRARRLAELGLATVVEGNPCDETAIAMAIQHALAGPRPRYQLNLDGVAGSQAFIEAHGRGARCRSTRTSASRSTPV